MFVPVELPQIKFFKGDRWKNKETGRKARMDSLVKTLEFVSQWWCGYSWNVCETVALVKPWIFVRKSVREKKKVLKNIVFSRLFFGRGTRTRTLGTRFWRPLIKSSVTHMNTTFSDKVIDAYYSLYYNFWKRYFMHLFLQKISHF